MLRGAARLQVSCCAAERRVPVESRSVSEAPQRHRVPALIKRNTTIPHRKAETFSTAELDFSVEVCEAVMDILRPTTDKPLILNLPATVEAATTPVPITRALLDCMDAPGWPVSGLYRESSAGLRKTHPQ